MFFVALVLPLAACAIHGRDNGHLEDVGEGVRMLDNSQTLQLLGVGLVASLAAYNPLSQMVAQKSGSTLRIFMSALRTIGVWVGGLVIHFVAPTSGHGEEWGDYSWLQLVGFLAIVAGIVTFNVGRPTEEPLDSRPRTRSLRSLY